MSVGPLLEGGGEGGGGAGGIGGPGGGALGLKPAQICVLKSEGNGSFFGTKCMK